MPWGSRRAAALLKSGGSRSSLAVAVASLSVTEPRRPGRAGEPGASRGLGAAEQSRAESRAGLGAELGWEQLPTQSPAPGPARTPQ